jgi:mono/diheme cytochrome c family protein
MKAFRVSLLLCMSALACAAQSRNPQPKMQNVAASALTTQSQQQAAGTSQDRTIKNVPLEPTSAASAQEMYVSYCAACHGKDGKGDGPAASALKEPPPDLTTLAKNNKGKFPAEHVAHVLQFGVEAPAHGTKGMPIWGPLFGSLHGKTTGSASLIQLRITNLTNYIKTLQSK